MIKGKRRSASRLGVRMRARAGKSGRSCRVWGGAKTRGRPPHPDPKVVRRAEKIFAGMGMTPYEAVVIFYKQTALHGDFPITELIPNEATQEAIWDSLAGIGIKKYDSVAEMRADLLKDA